METQKTVVNYLMVGPIASRAVSLAVSGDSRRGFWHLPSGFYF